jgi:hypothetical protein
MFRALQLWWQRLVDRRNARRLAEVGRWSYAPRHRRAAFGKAHFGRSDRNFPLRRWLRRLVWLALAAAAAWFLWENWRGWEIYSG